MCRKLKGHFSFMSTFNPSFETAFKNSIGHEGGYQNNPNDRGNWTSGKVGVGELKGTKYGISAMAYPHLDIKNLTLEQAKAIYWSDYWTKAKCEQLPDSLAVQFFDAIINHGISGASKILQRAIGVKDDGIIGNVTLTKIKSLDEFTLCARFLAQRLSDMTTYDKWPENSRGWSRRIADNLLISFPL